MADTAMDDVNISISTFLAVAGLGLSFVSIIIVILTFWFNRKKDTTTDGEWKGELKSDLKHIREGVDELKTNTSQMRTEMGDMKMEIHDVKKSVAAAHQRIDDMQSRKEKVND